VGQFLEYIGYPHQPLKHVPIFSIGYMLEDEQPRIVSTRGREDEPLVFTSVGDIAGVVRRAVEYEGEWPVIGGVAGNKISPRQVQKIVERIRGMSRKASTTRNSAEKPD
jgi:nucleoside-diphosphate-sugar epimerase